jgi:diacylglycerol kinase (ATP)
MDTVFVVNPNASSYDEFADALTEVALDARMTVEASDHEGHAATLARRAAERGADRVIGVGGDGTINEIVNGLWETNQSVALGILPAGTGNDIARSLGLPLAPSQALEVAVETGVERAIDVLRADWRQAGASLAVNAINGGYAPQVAEDITDEMKERFGPLAYLAAAPRAWRNADSYQTQLQWADGTREVLDAVALIAANGKTLGGGFSIAPEAQLDDGQFDVFCVRGGSVVDMAGIAARLGAGTLAESEHVLHRATTRLHVETRPPMRFTLDGEAVEADLTGIELQEGALQVIVPSE